MLMTREQAAATWCPMVRIARHETINPNSTAEENHIVAGCNTDALGKLRVPASCRCIAEQCAMWRWSSPPRHEPFPAFGSDMEYEPNGYCGLAGSPVV